MFLSNIHDKRDAADQSEFGTNIKMLLKQCPTFDLSFKTQTADVLTAGEERGVKYRK